MNLRRKFKEWLGNGTFEGFSQHVRDIQLVCGYFKNLDLAHFAELLTNTYRLPYLTNICSLFCVEMLLMHVYFPDSWMLYQGSWVRQDICFVKCMITILEADISKNLNLEHLQKNCRRIKCAPKGSCSPLNARIFSFCLWSDVEDPYQHLAGHGSSFRRRFVTRYLANSCCLTGGWTSDRRLVRLGSLGRSWFRLVRLSPTSIKIQGTWQEH